MMAGSLSAVGLSRLRGVGSWSTSTTASGADLTTGPRSTVAFGTLRIPPSRSVALTCFPRGGSDTGTHPLQHLTSDVRICSAHVGIDALVSSDQPVTDVVLGAHPERNRCGEHRQATSPQTIHDLPPDPGPRLELGHHDPQQSSR